MKECNLCGEPKPLEGFHRDRSQPDGHRKTCKTCACRIAMLWKLHRPKRLAPEPKPRAARTRRWPRYVVLALEKRCGDCGEVKPITAFKGNPKRRDRRQSYCADCAAARSRVWYHANHEHALAYREEYYERNRERERERVALWYLGNRERLIANALQRRRENPEKQRIITARYRARKASAFVEEVDPQLIFERDGGICGICRSPVDPGRFHIDHVIPLARGGTHEPANVQIAHPSCNCRKSDRLPEELAALS